MQAEGQLARDEAFLKNAESDLALYKQLIAQDSIAAQQVTTQDSLVKQYRGVIETDKGQIANANFSLFMPALSPRLQDASVCGKLIPAIWFRLPTPTV